MSFNSSNYALRAANLPENNTDFVNANKGLNLFVNLKTKVAGDASASHGASVLIAHIHGDGADSSIYSVQGHGEGDRVLSRAQRAASNDRGAGISGRQRESGGLSVMFNGHLGGQGSHVAGNDVKVQGKRVAGVQTAGHSGALGNGNRGGAGQTRTSVEGDVDGAGHGHKGSEDEKLEHFRVLGRCSPGFAKKLISSWVCLGIYTRNGELDKLGYRGRYRG